MKHHHATNEAILHEQDGFSLKTQFSHLNECSSKNSGRAWAKITVLPYCSMLAKPDIDPEQ